jgi:hypothetical protein
MDTTLTAKLLQGIMDLHGWNQFGLADRAKLHRTTVGQHLNCTRAIRDEHLIAYLSAVPTPDAPQLLSAWLHDLLDKTPEILALLLTSDSDRLREDVLEWAPNLTPRQKSDLGYWAKNIPVDADLDTLMQIITRRARGGE